LGSFARRLPTAGVTHWVRHSLGTGATVSNRVLSESGPSGLPLRRPPKLGLARGPSSSEFLCALAVLSIFRSRARLPGFQPYSRHHRLASTTTAASQATATFHPQAFSASRRFAPRDVPPACFIRQPRPGFSTVQGLLPSRSLSSLVGKSCPHAVSRAHPHRPKSAARWTHLGSEALLRTRSRCLTVWCYPPRGSLPSSVSRLLRALASALPSGYPAGSAHDVTSRELRLRFGLVRPPSASLDVGPDLSASLPVPARSKLSSLP
jgi:hypothetical protein